jgi:DNA-binding CsgD family transcriptional regulator
MKEFVNEAVTTAEFISNETTSFLTNQIFDNIHAFVFVFDYEKRIPVWINKYYETRMGYSLVELDNLTANDFMALFHPDSLKLFLKRMSEYNNNLSEEKKTVYRLKTKNNEWINMMINSNVLKWSYDGQIKYLIGYGVEIIDDKIHKSLNFLQDLEAKSHHLLAFDKLSKRELEIIKYIGNCMTDKEIAEKLNISIHTTKTHRKKIIGKLGLKNTASLVKLVVESGLV